MKRHLEEDSTHVEMLEAEKVFMNRALELARRGAGLVSPNPLVGAVLVKDGRIVGEGYHVYETAKHAELYALEQARGQSRGSTLYCSLEPCCHHGRTPPCTDSLIEAGIARAVIATKDPNPRVNTRGIQQLRYAGIEVEVGLCEEEAIRLNEAYSKFIVAGIPFIHGVVEDECASGDRGWMPSASFLEDVCFYDAVIVADHSATAQRVLACQAERKRHRPRVVVAREAILNQLRSQTNALSDDTIQVVISDDSETGVNLPAGSTRSVHTFDKHPEPLQYADSLSAALDVLGKMNVTSVVILPGAFDLSDPTNFDELDKLTLVVPNWVEAPMSSRLSLGDLEFAFDEVRANESAVYTELTGYPRLLEIA